jgi:hypothetical protein
LAILSNVEVLAPDIGKAFLPIECDGAQVSLPHAQPQMSTLECMRRRVRGGHQPLRHALSVHPVVDVETV